MTANEVIDQIKALPPEEKSKVVESVEQEIEARLLSEESPAMLAAIDAGLLSLEKIGGRFCSRTLVEQKVRQHTAFGVSR